MSFIGHERGRSGLGVDKNVCGPLARRDCSTRLLGDAFADASFVFMLGFVVVTGCANIRSYR